MSRTQVSGTSINWCRLLLYKSCSIQIRWWSELPSSKPEFCGLSKVVTHILLSLLVFRLQLLLWLARFLEFIGSNKINRGGSEPIDTSGIQVAQRLSMVSIAFYWGSVKWEPHMIKRVNRTYGGTDMTVLDMHMWLIMCLCLVPVNLSMHMCVCCVYCSSRMFSHMLSVCVREMREYFVVMFANRKCDVLGHVHGSFLSESSVLLPRCVSAQFCFLSFLFLVRSKSGCMGCLFLFYMPYHIIYIILLLLLLHVIGGKLCIQPPHCVPFDSVFSPILHQTPKGWQQTLFAFDPATNYRQMKTHEKRLLHLSA